MQPSCAGQPTPGPPAAAAALGAVAAAILESERQLGCSRCRYAQGGCQRCRNPNFKPRGSPGGGRQQQAGAAAPEAPAVARGIKGKRRRKTAPAAEPLEPLLHTLRRQLQSLHTDSGSMAPAPDAAAGATAGGTPPGMSSQQQLKRAAEEGQVGRPAKYLKADPELVSSLLQQQQRQQITAPAAASKRGASSEPSPMGRRPAKKMRTAPESPQPAAAAGAAAQAQAKRPPAEQQAQQPAKFQRVAPPFPTPQQEQQPAAASAVAEASGSGGEEHGGAHTHMDVDVLSPRKRTAAAAMERSAVGGSSLPSAAFLAQLEENMQLRRQERQSAASPHPLASADKRHKPAVAGAPGSASQSSAAPAKAAAGTLAGAAVVAVGAGAEEPDPRLCLWEPPVSPYGLLEEELYDDPWKLLVACLLLNKTSGTQVRKVIWELFSLCPTPAAAMVADVQQVQTLIQPLGLFRKRALAIQQLSHDYLYKQWRDPTELFGIGKYAADAYHMFCRGRWREVAPDDKDLKRYCQWLEQTGGLGTGLTRHRTIPLDDSK